MSRLCSCAAHDRVGDDQSRATVRSGESQVRICGCPIPAMTSSVITTDFTPPNAGISYIRSSITSSRIVRSARAPVFMTAARRAMAFTAGSVNRVRLPRFREGLILPHQRVARFSQYSNERRHIEVCKGGQNRKSADELGNESKLQ